MKTLLALLILAFNGSVLAQSDGRSIAVKAVFDSGEVKIRWATGSPVVWKLLQRNGVILHRQEASEAHSIMMSGNRLHVREDAWWKSEAVTNPIAGQVGTLLSGNEKDARTLTDYAQADFDQNRLTSLLLIAEFRFDIAVGLALGYRDKDIQPKSIYRYTVLLPDSVMNDTIQAECFVSTEFADPLIPVQGLQAQAGDGYIDLVWDRGTHHSGYFVERRAGGGNSWRRLNTLPKIYAENYPGRFLYRDSVQNEQTYSYRVIGIDAFARESQSIAEVDAVARDKTAPRPPYDLRWKKHGGSVQLVWKNPPSEPDLAGYALLRSSKPDAKYTPVHQELLKPGTVSMTDSIPGAGTYFYRLVASDLKGNVSSMSARVMVVIDDTIPPLCPEDVMAEADTTGVVTVRWRQRREDDIAGYRIYRMIAGGRKPEFVPLHSATIVDTVWRDTLNADVRDRFVYRVRSVDFAGNYSEPSSQAAVRFPDRIPPVAPLIQDYAVKDGIVRLRFISPSTDVALYEIHRTSLPDKRRDMSSRTSKNEWRDSSARHGNEYQYDVAAVDSSGNISDVSRSITVKPYWSVELKLPTAPSLSYDTATRSVTVRWRYPQNGVCMAIVFRKVDDGKFMQLSPLVKTDSYFDQHVASGAYQYALRLYYPERGGTALGEASTIHVP